MAQYDRTYYGSATDINLAKQQGLQGKFYDVSTYGDGTKLQDLLHAYKTGANPVILGGAGAKGGINDSLYNQLASAGANIQRIGGKDRYEVQDNFRNYATGLDKQRQVSSIYDQQQKSQLDALKSQREKAIGGINQQKAELAPQYAAQRNQADVVNQQNVSRLREIMAANGLSATGENVTANVAQNNQRQQSLNQLNLQQQQQMNDYNRQINGLNDPAQEQAIIAQIQAQKAQALLDAQNRSEDIIRDESRYKTEQAWRQHTFNNMSATEKQQLEWAKQTYGEDAAWRMFEMKYNGELAKSASQAELAAYQGFNGAQGGVDTSGVANTSGIPFNDNLYKKYSGYSSFKNHMAAAVQQGVDPAWVPLLSEIIKKESSFNPKAKNPNSTAHGYGQFLNSTRQNYEKKTGLDYDNPVHQLIMMAEYVKDRYKTPAAALDFWNRKKWY